MQEGSLSMSGRIVLDGDEVIEKNKLIRVRINFSNGTYFHNRLNSKP